MESSVPVLAYEPEAVHGEVCMCARNDVERRAKGRPACRCHNRLVHGWLAAAQPMSSVSELRYNVLGEGVHLQAFLTQPLEL